MTEPCSTPRFFDFLLDDEPSLLFGTDCTSVVDSVGDWIFRDPADDDTAAAAMQRHDSHINVGPTPSPAQRRRKATTPATPAATTGSPRRQRRATDPRTRNTPKAPLQMPLQIKPTEDELAECRRRLFAGCTPRLHPNAIGLRTPETPRKRCRDNDSDTVLRRSKRLKVRPFRYWLGEG